MPIGHQLGLRLFLEGVETPVIAASISIAQDTPAAASIQVIATDKVLDLLPRTVVHLFFFDFVAAGAVMDPPSKDMKDEFNSQYRLLFMGEVQGIVFQKDAAQRMATLQCVDFSNYWDTTYQYNFQGSLFGQNKAAFIGANTNLLGGPLGHGVGTFAALLNGKSANFPDLKGLLAGIVRCLEAIGGCYYGDNTFKGANEFTSIAELRLKILQQITAAEKDSSTAKLFARKTFNMWMNRQMGSLGKLVTFRGVVQILQQFIFHNVFPCPAARYVRREKNIPKSKTYAIDIHKDPRARAFIDKVKQLLKVLKSAKEFLSRWVVVDTQSGTVKYFQTVAKKLVSGDVFKQLENDIQQCRRLAGQLQVGTPNIPGLNKEVQTIATSISKADGSLTGGSRDCKLKLEYLNQTSRRDTANNNLELAISACETILGMKIKKVREYTQDKLDRVNNQILRPDVWFCSAPRTNVLFPELYQSFQWSRNFLREISRLELQTTNEILGDDALFNGYYYAPNVADMRKGMKLSSRQFGKLILAHELLTGIIPMYEKMGEANLFAMKSRQSIAKGVKVSYAQRAVNHQYFKHRFASRQMSAEGRFNPWFVPGFPAVLIDRPMDHDKLIISGLPVEEQMAALDILPVSGEKVTRAQLLQQLVPVQYFGCCTQLQHSVGQQGGNTSYAFEQARVHREDTEFLGVDKAEVSKKIGSARRVTKVVAVPGSAPKKNGRGPNGGSIVSARDVTASNKNKILPIYGGKGKAKVGSKAGEVVSQYFTADTKPPEQPKSGEQYYKAYEVVELFTRRAKVKVDLPIEECVRPPWLWDGWDNLKIGETYMQFFGTNSITDIEGFTSDDMLKTYESEEVTLAFAEKQEGLAQGAQKKSETEEEFIARINKEAEIGGEGEKNKPEKGGTSPVKEVTKKVTAAAILTMEKERTIENAVDYLVKVYSFVRSFGMDIGEFIRNYTWRSIATMPEILGSDDFTLTEKKVTSAKSSSAFIGANKSLMTETIYVPSGQEGFHSRAFGDKADLFGLVNPSVKKILGLSKDKAHATAMKMDVRKRRRQAVWDYVNEITSSRGLLG